MPHILIRFMAVKSDKELNKAKVIGIIWVAMSLFAACLIGIIGRAYLVDNLVESGEQERVFMYMIMHVFSDTVNLPFFGGIFLCGILAAIMSTADSQLLVTASSVTEDIYKGFMGKKPSDEKAVWISRVVVLVVAILAFCIAYDPNSSIMGLVSDAWAGLGSAFGPIVLMSLYWRRTNTKGAIAGIAVGAITVLVWDYLPLAAGSTLYEATGLYSLILGFALSMISIIAVSLLTEEPEQDILDEFDKVKMSKNI